MKALSTLKREEKILVQKIRKVRDEIEQIEITKNLPKLKEKYEGKYWKFQNSCGDEKWWLYSYCINVTGTIYGLFNSFEKTSYEYQFKIREQEYFHLCQFEITKEEYHSALDEFLKEVNKLKI